jgi:glutathione synthase/RimK-type ligase-like ATP-grasp enzyme
VILLCGIPSESPLARVAEEAALAGVPCVVFNQREAPWTDIVLEADARGVRGTLLTRGGSLRLEDVDGVLLRLMDPEALPEASGARRRPGALERLQAVHTLLLSWLEMTPARVLNRASTMGSNASKPYQSQLIRQAGFAVPETLVTTEPEAVREFAARVGRVIYKSISATRSIVRELDPASLRRIDHVRVLPTQFQEFVPGVNVRVHVVGDALFATEARTEAVDYRYAVRDGHEIEMSAVELPPDIAGRCVNLSHVLDLPFCGIDLKRTPEGRFFCFEVNPSPGYTYYEEQTGQPIARAVMQYLAPWCRS